MTQMDELQKQITRCNRCPRLREHCKKIAKKKRKSFSSETYWGKPVPSFGPANARLIIVGLAPAAHGANRTGRMFTGDRSGDWLYRALHKAGFANQPESIYVRDGLKLKDAFISAAAHCAPPDNKPLPEELDRCRDYLLEEFSLLKRKKIYLCLGQISLNALWKVIKPKGMKKPKFGHGAKAQLPTGEWVLMSYHPSQQNTFTKRLTEPMFDAIFSEANRLLGS